MKSQVNIISAILILGISVGLVSLAYTWGLPLIQKRKDTTKFESLFSLFDPSNPNSLERLITSIANKGGEEIVTLPYEGIWIINERENSIALMIDSKISGIAPDTYVSLLPGGSCPSGSKGRLGVDEPFEVCCFSKSMGTIFNITFKIWFRDLVDENGRIYRLKIFPLGSSSLKSKNLLLRFDPTNSFEKEDLVQKSVGILLR